MEVVCNFRLQECSIVRSIKYCCLYSFVMCKIGLGSGLSPLCYVNRCHGLKACGGVNFRLCCIDALRSLLYCQETALVRSVTWGIQAYISFRFQVFPCFPCVSFPSAIEGSGYGGPTPEDVGWCTRGHSLPQSRGLAAWDCICGALIKFTSEDMSDVVPCWYHMGGERSVAVVALSPFTLRGSSIDALAGTLVSVKVYRSVKADRMAVFGGCGCAVFSLDPRTSDLENEITDLRGVNLFAPLPLPFLSYLGPETVLLGSLWFGCLSTLLGPKLRPGWEAKFGFGVS